MSWTDYFPCTKWVKIGDGISYRLHKHWGMNAWAGEGLKIHNEDRSGCLVDETLGGHIGLTCKPIVVLQRIYKKGKKEMSAVLSYPHGITGSDEYCWEIYPMADGDIERFFGEKAEQKMERRIKKELLNIPRKPRMSKKKCPECGGYIAIRNPTGECDHLYYPELVKKKEKV